MQSMKTALLLGAAALVGGCQGAPIDSGAEAAAAKLLTKAPAAQAAPAPLFAKRVKKKARPAAKAPATKAERRVAGSTNTAAASKGYSSSKYAGIDTEKDDPRFNGFRAMAESFPWRVDDSGTWNGSGVEDPEPLQDVSDEEMLKRANSEGFTDDRGNALVSIGRRKMPGALDALDKALDPNGEQFTRILAISGLVEHGGEGALELLWKAMMNDPDGGNRGQAIWGIALYGHDEALKAIRAGLEDEDAGTRGMAILATTALRDEEVTMAILDRAIRSDERGEFQEAAYVLSNVPTTRARRLLAEVYDQTTDKDKRITMRYYLKEALRNRVPALD